MIRRFSTLVLGAFVALAPALRTLPATADVPEAAIARAQRSVVLVECPGTPPRRLTGVVLLSQPGRSYVAVSDLFGCTDYRVRLNGDMASPPLPAHAVTIDKDAIANAPLRSANFNDGMFVQNAITGILGGGAALLAVDAGGLTAIPFVQPPHGHASLFALSYADSVFAMLPNAKRVDPRLDVADTGEACANFGFPAASGIGASAPLFSTAGALVGIVTSHQPNASDLDPRMVPEARTNYFASNIFAFIALLHYALPDPGVPLPAWRC
jgi:hypothetical protein